MATRGKPPQNRNTRRTPARKPATIDLKAKDITEAPKSGAAQTPKPDPAKPTSAAPKPDAKSASVPNSGAARTASPASSNTANKSASKSTPAKASDNAPKKSAPSSKPPQKPAAAKPEKSSPGFLKLIAAAIIGAIISFLGVGALLKSELLPQYLPGIQVNSTNPALEKIAELQSQINALKSATPTSSSNIDLSPLETRMTALENAPQPSAGGTPDSTLLNELQTKIDAVAGRLETITTTGNSSGGIDDSQIAELVTRIAKLETTAPVDLSAIDGLKGEIAKSTTSLTNLTARLENFETSIDKLSTRVKDDVTERLNSFEAKLKTAATGEKLAKTVTINALKSAIQRGEPFAPTLSALEIITGSSPALDALKSYGQKGVPTDKTLIDEFHALNRTIIAAGAQDPQASAMTQLMANVRSLVAVRPSGAISGSSTQAILSRIDSNLKSDNFGGAISEWKNLPDASRQASKSWLEKLEARMDADRQIYKLLTQIQKAG